MSNRADLGNGECFDRKEASDDEDSKRVKVISQETSNVSTDV